MEDESPEKDEVVDSEDPDGIEGVMEEFMVCLVRAVKDAQKEEKHCYHCSSLDHFIHDCPLSIKNEFPFKPQGGDGTKEGSPGHSDESYHANDTPGGSTQGIEQCAQTPFLNPKPFQQWYGVKNVAKVKINGESCMAFLDNSVQINTIMPSYMKRCSLKVGPIIDRVDGHVACVDLGKAYTWPLGYFIIWVQVEGVQGYNEDQIALAVPDLSNFAAWVPIILGTPTISHVVNVMKAREIAVLVMLWENA